jgi:hypothetical protein
MNNYQIAVSFLGTKSTTIQDSMEADLYIT